MCGGCARSQLDYRPLRRRCAVFYACSARLRRLALALRFGWGRPAAVGRVAVGVRHWRVRDAASTGGAEALLGCDGDEALRRMVGQGRGGLGSA